MAFVSNNHGFSKGFQPSRIMWNLEFPPFLTKLYHVAFVSNNLGFSERVLSDAQPKRSVAKPCVLATESVRKWEC